MFCNAQRWGQVQSRARGRNANISTDFELGYNDPVELATWRQCYRDVAVLAGLIDTVGTEVQRRHINCES